MKRGNGNNISLFNIFKVIWCLKNHWRNRTRVTDMIDILIALFPGDNCVNEANGYEFHSCEGRFVFFEWQARMMINVG